MALTPRRPTGVKNPTAAAPAQLYARQPPWPNSRPPRRGSGLCSTGLSPTGTRPSTRPCSGLRYCGLIVWLRGRPQPYRPNSSSTPFGTRTRACASRRADHPWRLRGSWATRKSRTTLGVYAHLFEGRPRRRDGGARGDEPNCWRAECRSDASGSKSMITLTGADDGPQWYERSSSLVYVRPLFASSCLASAAAAAAAVKDRQAAAAVGIGGATTDCRPCRVRARVVLAARGDGARPHAARRRAA